MTDGALDLKLRAMEHTCIATCVVNDEMGTELHYDDSYPFDPLEAPRIRVTLADRLRYWWHELMEGASL